MSSPQRDFIPDGDVTSTPCVSSYDAKEDENNHYSFLVHSHKTLSQDLPPKVANGHTNRTKRRRTSPCDHAILEEEYRRDPKPSKAARASIVQKVSMGDREVQIWFQNRRQNDRRRSKPLQQNEDSSPSSQSTISTEPGSAKPLERAQFDQNALDHSQFTILTFNAFQSSADDRVDGPDGPQTTLATPERSFAASDDGHAQTQTRHAAELNHPPSKSTSITSNLVNDLDRSNQFQVNEPSSSQPAGRQGLAAVPDEAKEGNTQLSALSGVGGPNISDIKPAPSLRISFSTDREAVIRGPDELSPYPTPQKSHPAVRISMSADGEACVRGGDDFSPIRERHPETTSRRPNPIRHRTSSANALSSLREQVSSSRSFGRSKDSKLWEMYCDSDARSTSQPSADRRAMPVAAGPKVLDTPTPKPTAAANVRPRASRKLKRVSTVSVAQPTQSRQALAPRDKNATSRQTATNEGPLKKRKKLSRAASSLARLELNSNAPEYFKPTRRDLDFHHSGDSDKENWEPGTRTAISSTRPYGGGAAPGARQMSEKANAPSSHRTQTNPACVSEPEDGGREHRPTSQSSQLDPREDLDCIQGLLSLSQGAWR